MDGNGAVEAEGADVERPRSVREMLWRSLPRVLSPKEMKEACARMLESSKFAVWSMFAEATEP